VRFLDYTRLRRHYNYHGIRIVVDKRVPKDTVYFIDKSKMHWQVPLWRRILGWLRREWWV
jgi:hypothetical protein